MLDKPVTAYAVLAAALIGVSSYLVVYLHRHESGGAKPVQSPVDQRPLARAMCKEFLTKHMHDPSSADFGEYWNWTALANSDGTWSVGAKYRARNGYGAIRSEYTTCVMRRSGDSWSLVKATRMI